MEQVLNMGWPFAFVCIALIIAAVSITLTKMND